MKKKLTTNSIKRGFAILMAAFCLLAGSNMLPVQAAKSFSKSQTLDADASVAYCDGTNPNKVTSTGVTFMAMNAIVDPFTNNMVASKNGVLMSAKMTADKTAFVLQFTKPIDANKLEYMTFGMFAGADCKVRVYDSKTTKFIEDTAKDVLLFSSWEVEQKTIVLKKYADKDGYVRNITFYIASTATERSIILDYFKFEKYQPATADLTLQAVTDTSGVNADLGENQVPTLPIIDENVLKGFGWDGAIYTDGTPERLLRPGKYMTINVGKINASYYGKIAIDFFAQTATGLELTFYVYGSEEIHYNRENATDIVTVKGGEVTSLELDVAKLADSNGYVSQINLLLVRHSNKTNEGYQFFLGDVTFKLPREYANVNIYTEKLGGGYEKSSASSRLEGLAGEKVSISPYAAEELGLYGYKYASGENNVLSGVLKEGTAINLNLYYRLIDCKVTINNEKETIKKKFKYGTTFDLMEFRNENMLMNVQLDGVETTDTTVKIKGDTVIDITQTPGNYVYFVVDDEIILTKTYTPDTVDFEEPLVPLKFGYVGAWEEYELDGTDKTIHAIYTKSEVGAGMEDKKDSAGLINVANKLEKESGFPGALMVFLGILILAVVAAAIILLVILVKRQKIGKRPVIIGGSAVAVCCAVLAVVLLADSIFPRTNEKEPVVEVFKFDTLYTSDEAKAIEPQETITYNIDEELKDKNYIEIDVESDVNLLGTVEYYNLADSSVTNKEEFFIEGASEEAFRQFLDNYRENGSGRFEKHLTAITLTNVSETAGTVTLNEVGISDRQMDLSNAEIYVENDYLKVGMDLLCGGALTYLERLSFDGEKLQEVMTADGDIALGLNYAEKEGAELLSDSVNLINIIDKGREIQQSFYANVDEENGYTRGNYEANVLGENWPYNPVQGGDQDDNSSQIIDYRVEENVLYVKTRAMDWGQHNVTTKSYMENWYTLKDDMLYVKNRFIDWNGFTGESKMINNEMPAVYFVHGFSTFATYEGTAPWTDGELDIQKSLGEWAVSGGYVNNNPTEGWFAWVNEDNYGVGMYVPGIEIYASGRADASRNSRLDVNKHADKSSMLTNFRPDKTSDYTQCYVQNTSYTAPVLQTSMDQYIPLEYTYVIRVDELSNIRSVFKNLAQEGSVDNSGLTVWDE